MSDPVRLGILRKVAEEGELCCGACGGDIPKATLSHHLKVLREAGIIHVRACGTQRCISLRQSELEGRFPGLLCSVLSAAQGEET
jgi:DNA-binding transcriptional ArsR family regulator